MVALADLEAAVDADPSNEAAWNELMNAWVKAGDPRGAAMLFEHARPSVTPAEFLERKRAHEPVRRLRNAHTFGALGSDAYRVRATLQRGLVDRLVLRDERDRALHARAFEYGASESVRPLRSRAESRGARGQLV